MDLKKFKKVGATKSHTIFEHPDGHTIHVAHQGLPKSQKNELRSLKMNKGGKVKDEDKEQSPFEQFGSLASANHPLPKPDPSEAKKFAQGMQGYAEGGQVEEPSLEDMLAQKAAEPPPQEPQRQPNSMFGNMLESVMGIPSAEAASPQMDGMQPQQAQPAQPSNLMPPQQPQAAPADPNADPYGMNKQAEYSQQGYESQQQGLLKQAGAEADLGKAQANVLQKQQDIQQKQLNEYQKNVKQLTDERQALINDFQLGHVDPNHFISNMTTGSKVMTAIGMVLSGMGAGLSHQPNLAAQFLQKQIDEDIEAQKFNITTGMNKQKTLLEANLHQFGNMHDAMQMTRIMQSDIVSAKMQEEAAKSKDPLAQSRYLQVSGELARQRAPEIGQMALRKTMMNGLNQQQSGNTKGMDQTLSAMRLLDPKTAKEMESRYVPGVGMATIPLDAKVRGEIVLRKELATKLSKLEDFAKQHAGTVLDRKIVNQGAALAADAQDTYRRANGQGVFREAESNFVKSILSEDPTAFFGNIRTLPRYRAASDNNLSALNAQLTSYGLPEIKVGKPNDNVPKGYKK